jgi:predicted transposase/invertase (TIGR01784 family)
MQDTVRKTMETAIAKSKMEVDFKMTTNIVETIPWTNYREIFEKLEEQARAEGEARGKAEGEAKGKAKGEAKGKAEGKAEVARNLKKLKTMTNKEIAELTGLSVLEIEKL